jgi:hypothetical protein
MEDDYTLEVWERRGGLDLEWDAWPPVQMKRKLAVQTYSCTSEVESRKVNRHVVPPIPW